MSSSSFAFKGTWCIFAHPQKVTIVKCSKKNNNNLSVIFS